MHIHRVIIWKFLRRKIYAVLQSNNAINSYEETEPGPSRKKQKEGRLYQLMDIIEVIIIIIVSLLKIIVQEENKN